MIPLKLQIKNFLSYGPQIQTIDFSPYQLICLSGKNGHGKSALLDAITWALWGQARKTTGTVKADANLVHLGQTQMMVCLDFVCNDQTYRVRREYAKTYGKPYAALDFGIIDKENKTIISLADKTIRTTQQKIEQTIHLTFEAFINSAFLRQGQANEFSKKSPKDRKEIFAQILGLQQYEMIRKRAMEHAKEASAKKTGIIAFQEKLQEELDKSTQLEENIKTQQKELQNLETQEQELLKIKTQIEHEKKSLAEKQNEQKVLQFQQEQHVKKREEQLNKLNDLQETWKKVNEQQKNIPDQAKLEKEKKTLIDDIAKHQKTLQRHLEIRSQLLKQKDVLQKMERSLHEQHTIVLQDKNGALQKSQLYSDAAETKNQELTNQLLEKKQTQACVQKELEALTKSIDTKALTDKEFEKHEEQFNQNKETYQTFIAQGNLTRQELENLQQKQHLSHYDDNPSCPLCEQNLSSSRKKFLKIKFADQKKQLTIKIEQLKTDIKKIKETLIEQHSLIEKQKKVRDLNAKIQVQIIEREKNEQTFSKELISIAKQINHVVQTIKKTKEEQTKAQQELEKHIALSNKMLNNNADYQNIFKICNALEKELTEKSYDETAHKIAAQKVQGIEKKLANNSKLRDQIALQSERKKQIDTLKTSVKQVKEQQTKTEENLKTYEHLAKSETVLQKKEQNYTYQYTHIKKEKESLLQTKGALENQKEKLKNIKKEYKEQQKKVCDLDEIADDYFTIAQATSKNGIQALLIENAIPEIEQEANRLLEKLTNNQAQVFIESLRDLKKGGTKETLDIKISDSAGIRPYELFSGGEAFRIDFALRIAISKLLARRAGTSLQTLIIDEGFGSQDEEGLSNIMEAIHKIQDDFLKVIIVSHLTSMKDQFPVHFMVEKGANGSTVNVFELG